VRHTPYATPRVRAIVLWSLTVLIPLLHTHRDATAQSVRMTPGRILTLVKGDQPAEVREPFRAVVTDDGRLFLTDPKKGDVLWFDENLVWKGNLTALRSGGDLGRPIRTVLDSRGRIYVADSETKEILVFAEGELEGIRGGQGSEPGKFGSLDDIAIDSDDMLWAADGDRHRLYVFTPDGLLERVVNAFEGVGLDRPKLVDVSPDGSVIVWNAGAKTVVAGDTEGEHRWTLDLDAVLDGKELYDLEIDPTGALFLVLKDDSRVVIVGPTGDVRGEIFGKTGRPRSFERLTGLSISAARRVMVVVDQKDLVVQEMRLDPTSGDLTEPVHRTHIGIAIDTLEGRPLAVSSSGPGGEEIVLVREASGLVIRSGTGEMVASISMPGKLPDRVVAAGTSDGFIVVDRDHSARRFAPDGTLQGLLPSTTAGGQLKRPAAIAWRASDDVLAVYDRDDEEIQLLAADGSFMQRVGRKGRSAGEISKVVSLAFDNTGRLLVLDLDGSRLQAFDRHGIFVASAAPSLLGAPAGNVALGLGADAWGRAFILDAASGVAAQFELGRGVQCQVGAPWYLPEPRTLVVSPTGDIYVAGGKDAARAIRFRCVGAPPAPLGLRLARSADDSSEGLALTWTDGLPGAVSYEVFRSEGDKERVRIGSTSGTSFPLGRDVWGHAPGELWVRGVGADGQAGAWSRSITDRVTPAFRALVEGGDLSSAESWLSEELSLAEAEDRSDVSALRAAYLEAILAQGDYDRAAAQLQRFEAGLDAATRARLRMEIARSAVMGSIDAGAGAIALRWVGLIQGEDPAALSGTERRALELEAAGDAEAAGDLLVRYGRGRDLDEIELTKAVAEVQLERSRPDAALATLTDAAHATENRRDRDDLDQQIFRVSGLIVDGLLDGAIPPAPGLSAEQDVDRILAGIRDYLTQTGRGGGADGDGDAGLEPPGGAGDDSREMWDLRLGALQAKVRIHSAIRMEGSDFQTARELYADILERTDFLMGPDEVRVRSHIGALALARGQEEEARAEFTRVLIIDPAWSPDPDEFSPTVRDFVAALVNGPSDAEPSDAAGVDGP